MPRWTQDEYFEYLRKASVAVAKQVVCNEPVAAPKGEGKDSGRISVRIVSFRRRLLDPDNLCPKYFIDCLRYAEIIPNDRDKDITLEIRQEKVSRKEDEGTLIEITWP